MKYLEKMERRPDPDVRYPDEVECRSDIITAVRHPGGMSDDFYPGGMSYDFRSGGMSYATRRKGGRLRGQGRGSHVALFSEDPTVPIIRWKTISLLT